MGRVVEPPQACVEQQQGQERPEGPTALLRRPQQLHQDPEHQRQAADARIEWHQKQPQTQRQKQIPHNSDGCPHGAVSCSNQLL